MAKVSECQSMPCVPKPQSRTRNASFNPSHAQYACCFQQLHSNTGTTIIAGLHIALCFVIYPLLVHFINTGKNDYELAAEFFLTTLCLLSSIVLIVGLRSESQQILTGYILAQTVLISSLFVLFLALIMGVKKGILNDQTEDEKIQKKLSIEDELLIVLEIFLTLVIVAVEVWFLTVVLKTYRFICDKYNFTGGNREENV